MVKILVLVILVILSTLGIIYYFTKKNTFKVKEAFGGDHDCPDVLIQKGKHLYLINNRVARIPGVNPMRFNNLEEYVEFLNWQRFQGIRCPVLYLQNSYDIQGNLVYVNRKSPFEKGGGTPIISGIDLFNNNNRSLLLDSTRNHPPFNKNLYPGFDSENQDVGLKTPLDKMYHENPGGVSPNAMDSNWGGSQYTESRIKSGDYKQNEVKIYVPGSGGGDDDNMPAPPGGVDAVYGVPGDSNINLQKQYRDHQSHHNKVESEGQYIDQLHKENNITKKTVN